MVENVLIRFSFPLISAQGTSSTSFGAFSKAKVYVMFYFLKEILTKLALDTNNVYTMDGTGYSTVQKRQKGISDDIQQELRLLDS